MIGMIIATIFGLFTGVFMLIAGIKFFGGVEWRWWWDEILWIFLGMFYSGGGIVLLLLGYDALVCVAGWHLPNIITTF